MRSIFLDYSTTTPIAASVRESMLPFLSELYGHPSSSNWMGRAADEAIEDARSELASLLGCHPWEITFTSGGTESVNLGLLGVARAISKNMSSRPHFICSILEHAAVRQTAAQLEREGWEVSIVGCDASGVIKVDELQSLMRKSTRLMSIMHASHQLGTLQPIEQVAQMCHENDILLHSDAAQTVGKIESHMDRLGVDLLSLSGHKFYAPMGIGALYCRMGVPIEPIAFGESSEAGLRPGTANVAGIVGLGQAAKLAQAGLQSSVDRISEFRDRFHHQLESMLGQPLTVHGENAPRVPGILSLELPGVRAAAMERKLPEICFGPTTPCNGGTCPPADNTLVALGLSPNSIANTLRISFGWTTSEDELQRAVQMIAAAYDSLRDECQE